MHFVISNWHNVTDYLQWVLLLPSVYSLLKLEIKWSRYLALLGCNCCRKAIAHKSIVELILPWQLAFLPAFQQRSHKPGWLARLFFHSFFLIFTFPSSLSLALPFTSCPLLILCNTTPTSLTRHTHHASWKGLVVTPQSIVLFLRKHTETILHVYSIHVEPKFAI